MRRIPLPTVRHHAAFLSIGLAMYGCSQTADAPVESTSAKPSDVSPADVSPQEAKKILLSTPGSVYLDVRTVAEFDAGHAPNAWNIPIMTRNGSTGQMERNSEFLAIVKRTVEDQTRVIVGCRSGRRSQLARDIMRDAGYKHASNMLGGFSGKKGANGTTVHQGWAELGFEVETGDGGDRSYAMLKGKSVP